MDDRLQNAPVGVLIISSDGIVADINEVGESLIESTGDPTGAMLTEIFPRSVDDSLLTAFEGESVPETSFQEYYPDLDRWLDVSIVSLDEDVTVFLQDVTERRRHEQSIEQFRTERDRTAVIEDVLSEILTELVGATSREEIAETICRSLGEADIYEFAWIGEREIGSEELVIHAVGGEDDKTFAAIRKAVADETATTLEERAVESGRLQSAQPLADHERVPESVRTAGFADGVQSALAIPLVYGSNVHGVVGVYAAGTTAFSEREKTSFETLGEVAGFAVTAARNRNLLFSDTVAELTFEVGDSSVLSQLSQSHGSTLVLEGLVPRGDDTLLGFITVEDADIHTVATKARNVDGIEATRVIHESNPGGSIEVTLQGSSPLLAISSLGGTVREATFDSGVGQIVVELPPDADVRRIADRVSREYEMEFVAKKERERAVTTAREFRDALDDTLTERQQTVLQTAYFANYFESPRGSTAEEVAESLDITGSTLLHHLRAGQRKLLGAYLAEPTDTNENQ